MDIMKILVGCALIALVAVLIGLAAAYWYIWIALAIVGYAIYYFKKKGEEKRNRV